MIKTVKALYTLGLFLAITAVAEVRAEQVPAGLIRMGDGAFYSPFALVVDKSVKKIYVVDNSNKAPKVIETFESDVGKKPGPKHALNDHRTPEGVYFFLKWIDGAELDFEKYGIGAFVSNYPNYFDTRDGKGGYGIWLHAIADKVGLERGSRGCVVVRNETLQKIKNYIAIRQTPILIYDKIEWVDANQLETPSKSIVQLLADWKKSWETKDINSYMGFYASDFKFGKMNKEKWRQYKTELARRYENIKINLSMPVIYGHGKQVTVKFYQDYTSSGLTDFGEKTLYLQAAQNGAYSIVGEEWQEATQSNAKQQLASSGNKL